MKLGILALAVLTVPLGCSATLAQTYKFNAGEVAAIDGDTLRIGFKRIRLSAIDAPELSQICHGERGEPTLCGRSARDALQAMIRNGLRCDVETHDRWRREVATCINLSGVDVGRELVRQGWALPYWRYDGVRYAKAYDEAMTSDVGIHIGTFIEPEKWRRGQRW